MRWTRWLLAISVLVVITLVLGFVFRNTFVQWAFVKAQQKAKVKYSLNLTVNRIYLSGIDKISITNLVIQPQGADTLLQVAQTNLDIHLPSLLKGIVSFDEIRVDSAYLSIYNLDGRNNVNFIKQRETPATSATPTAKVEKSYRKTAEGLQEKLFRLLSTACDVRHIYFNYMDSSVTESIYMPAFTFDLKRFSASVINTQLQDTLIFTGTVIKKDEEYEFKAQHTGNDTVCLPFLNRQGHLKCRFNTMAGTLKFDDTGDELQVRTAFEMNNFQINHWRLAKEDVAFDHTQFTGLIKINSDAIELDSISTAVLNHTTARLFMRYQKKPDPVFTLNVHMPETVSDTFFNSLPRGMFSTLKGISCTGSLAYDLQFQINTNAPDDLIFYSSLQKKNLTIRHFGDENYARINGPFVYDAYNKGQLMRSFVVGPQNPAFTPLNKVNQFLPKSIMQSEDPSFMQHNGFISEAFRESIILNYKQKRFARGGSTISMQLVKNVFLSRNKTVSRKVEEALIVYLIENLNLVSKERMFEIYLNVIEWGPNVYGVQEAAKFYFNKKPADLTLQESIYLASIIPNPRAFRYQFDADGNLRNHLSDYYRVLIGRMLQKGWITEADTVGLKPTVKLRGPAFYLVLPNDTMPAEPIKAIDKKLERKVKLEEKRIAREQKREQKKEEKKNKKLGKMKKAEE